MKNLGVVITDGVGFRNFILSDFIKEANDNFDSVILFSCLPKRVFVDLNLKCKVVELAVFEETFKTWFFRKIKEVTHLQIFAGSNFGILDNLNQSKSKEFSPRGIAIRCMHLWSKFIKSENWILRYNKWQQFTFKGNSLTAQYQTLLEEHKISMLFFTHQRPPFIAPLIFAAEVLKIKTSTFIFSWDNLASKGRMAGNFNYYFVWSHLMKIELLHFYKSVQKENVLVVGTPQFEAYTNDKFGYSKEQFKEKFKVSKDQKIIFFTCNDASSKNDIIYLEILANFILANKLVEKVAVIVRTSPVEDALRFKFLADKFSFLIWNFPDWNVSRTNHQESWSQRVPSVSDLNDLKSLLKYCDICINVLSTITLDAFIFDKPVINPVFGNEANGMFDDQKFLNYAHLANLVDSKSSDIVKTTEEFLAALNNVLKNKEDKSILRAKFLELQISESLEGTSKRIAQSLAQLNG
ncbi:CDP-glycerol glycerophosphotransferase family protein [Flavobacterium sp. F-380]|uniref:CDP-glycerol glycerophosphotransferase family protein n=1 Tax=Flavobacterium kayseriense TaxID=2764714 RepID=A0ABR7J7E6_9FLAO|nr:CDP-glycerol glycerophosphotransferase family protein [Flavobacterium kayseriense]MBC5841422.1 CDP-glycerol glycerophosphotransferase family protein [Flavobacterium kayseriense]MBC5847950.1 CDP-glycerol glycerophosphotransferase family protein [Flavobacterium kayseriense]